MIKHSLLQSHGNFLRDLPFSNYVKEGLRYTGLTKSRYFTNDKSLKSDAENENYASMYDIAKL